MDPSIIGGQGKPSTIVAQAEIPAISFYKLTDEQIPQMLSEKIRKGLLQIGVRLREFDPRIGFEVDGTQWPESPFFGDVSNHTCPICSQSIGIWGIIWGGANIGWVHKQCYGRS